MNILLLYTMTVFDSFGQEPMKEDSVQEEMSGSTTLQNEETLKNNESSIRTKKEQNIESTKYIEGLSPQDNDMIQLMLNTGDGISHEQRLLSNISSDTEPTITRSNTGIVGLGNTSSDLFNFATISVVVVLFLLGWCHTSFVERHLIFLKCEWLLVLCLVLKDHWQLLLWNTIPSDPQNIFYWA